MKENGYGHYRKRIDQVCSKYSDWPAFRCMKDDGEIDDLTFGELHHLILKFEHVLHTLGLKKGDRVVLMDKHLPSAERTFISITYWNLTAVMVDASLPKEEIHKLIDLTDVRAVFTSKELAAELSDELKNTLPVLDIRAADGSYPVISACKKVSLPPTPDPDPAVIAILFSSGTTGSMKPIMISYDAVLFSWKTNTRAAALTHEHDYLYVFPLSHISGLESSLTLFLCGATLDMVENFTSSILPKALQTYQPVVFGMVPKVFDIMVQKMEETIDSKGSLFRKYYEFARKLSSAAQKKYGNRAAGRLLMFPFSKALFGKNIKVIFTGSAMCAPETASAIMDMGVYWCNLYASTECGAPITTTSRFDRYSPDSVGNVNGSKGIEVIIHNPDEKGVGEIYVKSRLMMTGYFRDPVLTAESFDNGYFRTGDLGYISKEGYLYLAGRSKEAIMLHTGKKVAPSDLEQILASASPMENSVVICGVPEKKKRFDEIHAFFEDRGFSSEEREQIKKKLLNYAREHAPLYPIKDVHFLKEIPKTSVFKVKRYLLAKYVQDKNMDETEEAVTDAPIPDTAVNIEENKFAVLSAIIEDHAKLTQKVRKTDRLYEDLNIDSLTIYEISAAIEQKWGISIGQALKPDMTVGHILELIENPSLLKNDNAAADDEVYPKKRTLLHKGIFNLCTFLSRGAWNLPVYGIRNLPENSAYILCANHESNLDTLWLFAALREKCPDLSQIACLAKIEILQNPYTRFPLTTIGGIPVDRSGNTAEAVQHACKWLKQGGCLLVFPEGTRTRNGFMGEFKTGAAQLALSANVPIVPVRIDGAFEAYRPGTRLPKMIDGGHRVRISITVKEPIYPDGKTPEELTREVKESIENR